LRHSFWHLRQSFSNSVRRSTVVTFINLSN
jgi:hypothetical protein